MSDEHVAATLQVRQESDGLTLVFHDGKPQPLEISFDRLAAETLVYDLMDALKHPPIH